MNDIEIKTVEPQKLESQTPKQKEESDTDQIMKQLDFLIEYGTKNKIEFNYGHKVYVNQGVQYSR